MMSPTTAYFLRLAAWGMLLTVLLGGPLRWSWQGWDRALRGTPGGGRHRVACGHFYALLILPGAMVGGIHLALATMGAEISRGPAGGWTVLTGHGERAGWLILSIVAVWAAGAAVAAAHLAFQAWWLCRLRGEPATASLSGEVHMLARRLPDRRWLTVRSADVPVPQVTGVAHPSLTLPVGFSRLSAEEREAVLLHELAHVARRDFAANLLQRLVLAVVWFQPAAWSLYRGICREREACCDQMALCLGASAPALARALVRMAEGAPPPTVALSAAGHGELRWRIYRLLTPEEPTSLPSVWLATLLGIAMLVLSGLGGARLAGMDGTVTDLYIASALGPVVSVRAHDPGGVFDLRIRRGRVLEASVENRPLSAENIRQRGDRVTLLGAASEPVVSFQVTPAGRINWRARSARTPQG